MAENNNPAAGAPNCNAPLMEYNTARLELIGIATRLRTFVMNMTHIQQNDFRNELCAMFREFHRAYPNAGLTEFEGLRLVMELGLNGERAGSYAEFAMRIAPHQTLVQAFRRLVNIL